MSTGLDSPKCPFSLARDEVEAQRSLQEHRTRNAALAAEGIGLTIK
jgi:hypothetical protein